MQYILSKPITAHGEQITQLELKEPTTAMARKVKGLPYIISAEGEMVPQLTQVLGYISECAGIPPSSVDQLDIADVTGLTYLIISFFTPSAESQQLLLRAKGMEPLAEEPAENP